MTEDSFALNQPFSADFWKFWSGQTISAFIALVYASISGLSITISLVFCATPLRRAGQAGARKPA